MMLEDPYAYVVATFQAPPSPDYVPGPKEPEQAPHLPEFVPELVYLKFMPLEDEILIAEEQPLPAADSPTADSPGYIPESDPEEDDEDPEEDSAGYPTDRDDDDDDKESSRDEADDEEDKNEEEEEHPALADFIPPPPVHRTIARISIPSNYDPAKSRDTIYFPSTTTYCTSTYQGICGHAESCCTIHLHLAPRSETPPSGTPPILPIPLPTSSPPLLLPSTSRREDVPEVTLPPRKRLCIALGLRFEVGESSSAPTARPTGGFRVDYGFVATLDDEIR
nr:hypothetical protein [Tanacetum cinerariifolium]